MLFGSHVSIAGGIENAPTNAHAAGCECFQIFSRSPRGGKPPEITEEIKKEFLARCRKYKFTDWYIHTPYFINFASIKKPIRWGSISIVREELERGSIIKAKAVMTHLGSSKDYGREKSVGKVIRAVHHVLEGYTGGAMFLLEQSAGAGDIIGGTLEELAYIVKEVEKIDRSYKSKLGICLDTCHACAMGYDLSSRSAVNRFVSKFDKVIGLERLTLIHANDSKFGCGEHKDRHEHIGKGKIGLEGFKALVQHKALASLNMILETPNDSPSDDLRNLAILEGFRDT
ncbi:MAG: deoxyribonuclease IV [Patescibacteria group bacterium]